ncbi:MAG: hypothetical protein H5T97_04225 [Firmicutes bacterium]|nr:hypothetical protein [Bacillota bacterium]
MEKFWDALRHSRQSLLRLENVVGVGIGFKQKGSAGGHQLALVVFVQRKVSVAALSARDVVPREVRGVRTDVVEIGMPRFLGRVERVRPAQPGVSIGHYQVTAGTFGAVVRDRETGEPLILSNNHVLANATSGQDGRAKIGDPVLQPGAYDGGTMADRIGELVRFVPLRRPVEEARCPVARRAAAAGTLALRAVGLKKYRVRLFQAMEAANLVDAALARPDRPDLVRPDIYEVGEVRGVGELEPGEPVLKSGRTSGVTRGRVTAIGATLQIALGADEVLWFEDQAVGEMISRAGDSGSLVLDENRRAVGLLFAGSERYTIFNPIPNVLEKLRVEL